MKEERTNDIDRMREYEDIRQVPLEPNRPASGRQNPPVGDSYIGGRPRRERISRRKPGIGDGAPEARTSAARKSADRTAQEVQNTGKKADRSQRSKKQEIQAQENTGTVRAKACPSLHFCWCSYWAPAPVWAEAITSGDGSGLIPWI